MSWRTRQPVTDGRWRYYWLYQVSDPERILFIGRCLGSEEGEWGVGYSEGVSCCSLYEDQDGYLYLLFDPEETPVRGHSGNYVKVWYSVEFMAETRQGLLDLYRRSFKYSPIPSLIVPPPEIEEMYRETAYDA